MPEEEKSKITQYRERLDKTLTSPDLTNKETLKTLVKNQLLQSSQHDNEGCNENLIEKRTAEVANFLDMLRSTSVNESVNLKDLETSHPEWKLKQDNEEFRVMYREGPKGTPFHMLLVEGYVDGPTDVCLCISWEPELYKKWWPQSSIPTFKVLSTKCLKKVRTGEQISLVRVKVAWPLSAREAVVHYFLFEYFQDDLIVVLLNSISNSESIDPTTHGFTNEGIPEAKDVVRIDLVGGFALQKVAPERSYFRTIVSMDMKLDFVPPSLINFISRQLVGNGFRLYQKAVASMLKNDEDFSKALSEPLYARIREALSYRNESERVLEEKELSSERFDLPVEHFSGKKVNFTDTDQNVHSSDHAIESVPDSEQIANADSKGFGEIEEEESEKSRHFEEYLEDKDNISTKNSEEKHHIYGRRKFIVSPEVEKALGTLDKVLYMVREYRFNVQNRSSVLATEETSNMEKDIVKNSNTSENGRVCSNGEVCVGISKKESMERPSEEKARNSSSIQSYRRVGSYSLLREVSLGKIVPASPEQDLSIDKDSNQVSFSTVKNGTTEVTIFEQTAHDRKQISDVTNGINESNLNGGKKSAQEKRHRFCCFLRS